MAEVQTSAQSGEMTRRFIEFVLMQAQQIALMLGHAPGPDGQPMTPNLPVAKIFIDQLEMIREKTRGNLTQEEGDMLNKVLTDLQLAYVEAGQSTGETVATPPPAAEPSAPTTTAEEPMSAEESKKKFTKSYG